MGGSSRSRNPSISKPIGTRSSSVSRRGGRCAMRFEARDYLETVFPALLDRSTVPVPKDGTVIQLVVADIDGCEYFYRISGEGVKAERGTSDQVDLTISFFSRDLGDLFENKLDVKRAVRTSRIQVFGDEEVLQWLSQRLAS